MRSCEVPRYMTDNSSSSSSSCSCCCCCCCAACSVVCRCRACEWLRTWPHVVVRDISTWLTAVARLFTV